LGGRKGIQPVKNIGGWWRWALVSPDGVAPSRMVSVSASVNLPLHHKVQKFSSGTGSPGWSRKKGRKMVVVVIQDNLRYPEPPFNNWGILLEQRFAYCMSLQTAASAFRLGRRC